MPELPADEDLVAAARAGDDSAFAALVARHKRRVFAAAARYARNSQQLEDLAQEIFVRVWKNLGQFRGDAPFQHWLSRVIVSACYDLLRKDRRAREELSLEACEFEFRDSAPDRERSAQGARELLAWAMGRLAPEEHLILTLCELEERPVREVSLLTGWSESNVKVRAFRAREHLKQILHQAHEK